MLQNGGIWKYLKFTRFIKVNSTVIQTVGTNIIVRVEYLLFDFFSSLEIVINLKQSIVNKLNVNI